MTHQYYKNLQDPMEDLICDGMTVYQSIVELILGEIGTVFHDIHCKTISEIIANLLAAVRFSAVDLLQSVSCSQLLQWLTSHGG